MTALKGYARLESTGVWRGGRGVPLRDDQGLPVGIMFGDATLVLTDANNQPLTHWSLPAVQRINPGQTPALFSADPDMAETLEVEDDLLIDALARVHQVARRPRKPGGRLRAILSLTACGAIAAIGVLWLPGALIRQTASNMAPGPRAEIGASLLGHIQSIAGTTCRAPEGAAALARLHTRVFGASAPGQTVIVPGALTAPILLPGSVIVLPQASVTQTNDPATVAGHMIGAASSVADSDPLARTLEFGGFSATLSLVTSGQLGPDVLQDYAQHATTTPAILAADDVLANDFERARVALAPWAYTLDPSGDSIAPLLDMDWAKGVSPEPLLSDADWVALQNICR